MISIILSFYDRDKDRINDITNHILSLSKDVELIIVDDRYDKSVSLNNKYIITPYEGNKGLVYSRYYGFIHSHGDYIWFIDADDKVLKIPELLDYDLQVFEYDNLNGKFFYQKESESRLYKVEEVKNPDSILRFFNLGLWNKIFKRELVEKVFSTYDIENCIDFFCMEDMVFNLSALSFIKEFYYSNDKIYEFYHHPLNKPFQKKDIYRARDTVKNLEFRNLFSQTLKKQGYRFY